MLINKPDDTFAVEQSLESGMSHSGNSSADRGLFRDTCMLRLFLPAPALCFIFCDQVTGDFSSGLTVVWHEGHSAPPGSLWVLSLVGTVLEQSDKEEAEKGCGGLAVVPPFNVIVI